MADLEQWPCCDLPCDCGSSRSYLQGVCCGNQFWDLSSAFLVCTCAGPSLGECLGLSLWQFPQPLLVYFPQARGLHHSAGNGLLCGTQVIPGKPPSKQGTEVSPNHHHKFPFLGQGRHQVPLTDYSCPYSSSCLPMTHTLLPGEMGLVLWLRP